MKAEEQAAQRIADIYDASAAATVLFPGSDSAGDCAHQSVFDPLQPAAVCARGGDCRLQRSELAQKLIATQESTLRHISRELHDEFGQVLTAIGSLLRRADKQIPEDSPLHADLQEVREIAQTTLNNIRSLSQALHPVLLDEAGLESTLDWYIPMVERQTGIALHYEKSGEAVRGGYAAPGVQIYRVVQEALNNVARHSGAKEAWVRLRFQPAQPGAGSGRSRERDSRLRQAKLESGWWRCANARRFWADTSRLGYAVTRRRHAGANYAIPREKAETHGE